MEVVRIYMISQRKQVAKYMILFTFSKHSGRMFTIICTYISGRLIKSFENWWLCLESEKGRRGGRELSRSCYWILFISCTVWNVTMNSNFEVTTTEIWISKPIDSNAEDLKLVSKSTFRTSPGMTLIGNQGWGPLSCV